MEVFCYPKEGETLKQECIKIEVYAIQSKQEEDKRIKHVEIYMHEYKCEENNDAAHCIPEKVVETLVKSTEEDKKLVDKDLLEEEITDDKTTEYKANLQVSGNS